MIFLSFYYQPPSPNFRPCLRAWTAGIAISKKDGPGFPGLADIYHANKRLEVVKSFTSDRSSGEVFLTVLSLCLQLRALSARAVSRIHYSIFKIRQVGFEPTTPSVYSLGVIAT